ncbi:MAG: hypothetical protein WC621_04615 [Patescibacteria group bacterium]
MSTIDSQPISNGKSDDSEPSAIPTNLEIGSMQKQIVALIDKVKQIEERLRSIENDN